MESSHNISKDIDVRMAPCGSCEGCSVTEDCCTKCENCVQNYIRTAIVNNSNPISLPCLNRMCLFRNIYHKRETVVRNNNIKDEHEMEPNQFQFNETEEVIEINRGMEHGETGFKKSPEWEDNLVISECGNNGREASNVEMCGSCLGCTTDCGDCWICIQRDEVATKDLTQKMICQRKKCVTVKEGIEIRKEEDTVKYQRRRRCGTCLGYVVAQNCDNCAPCLRRQKTKFRVKDVRNARKCHALKITKSKKMDELNSNSFQSNKIYGLGIKIKSKRSKLDEKMDQKKAEVDDDVDVFASEYDHLSMANDSLIDIDQLILDQTSKLTEVDKWLNQNVQFKENLDTDKKSDKRTDLATNNSNSKSVKRTKKCGECLSCQSEDCGHCRSCQINDQFSDGLVLGKVPCLTNICEFPMELTGDMNTASLMSLQDDSSNGTVCPVKNVNGVLYDFRCFFCKKLPRAGSANQLRKDFQIFMVHGNCLLCGDQLKRNCFLSHVGQKHNEIVNYLPTEAVALCPEVIQKEQMGGRCHQRATAVSSQTRSGEELEWPQVPKKFDPSKDKNWKGSTCSDPIVETGNNYEIVDGWIIKHVTNSDEDEELPHSDGPILDYSGVGGRCSVCQREFDQVTEAALHLHDDHDITGGSSHLMRDCQNFIKSGFIQVSKVQNEIPSATILNKPGEKFKSSPNLDGYLDFEAKRYVAKKSTSRKSRYLSSPIKEQNTRGNSQSRSLNDEENSSDEIGMEPLPPTIHDKVEENSSDEIGMELLPPTIHDKVEENSSDEIGMELLPPTIHDKVEENSSDEIGMELLPPTIHDKVEENSSDEIEMELLPPTIHNKAEENSTPSPNSDGYFMYLDFESKSYVAWQSICQKSRSSPMKEQITRGYFQHNSSNDEETSVHYDEIGMELSVEVDDALE